MKKNLWLSFLLIGMLMTGMITGCAASGSESGVKLIEPVYPPYYDQVYQELFGADLQTVCEKLGYTADELTLIMDENNSPLCYRTNETVSYLGRDFQMEFWLVDMQKEKDLFSVRAYAQLTGSAEDNALVVEELGETLQKMFGYTPAGEHVKWDGFDDLDPVELAQKLSGEEDWGWGMTWQLTDDVDHIPVRVLKGGGRFGPDESSVTLIYTVSYFPGDSTWVRIQYEPGIRTGDHLVRERE